MKHIVCTACGATNRIGDDRDARSGKCGNCGAALFADHPGDVTSAVFARQVAKSSIPVVVDVWAPWCGPCRVMGPEFAKAADAMEPKVRFIKLNSDEQQEAAARMGIRGIPTMLLYRDGKEVGRVSGAMPAGQIQSWIESQLAN